MKLKFHIRRLITEALPPSLRSDTVVEWMHSLIYPVEQDNYIFINDEDEIMDGLKHTGQKLMLEHYLNRKLQGLSGTCYIDHVTPDEALEQQYLYTDDELARGFYLYQDDDPLTTGATFEYTYLYNDYEYNNEDIYNFRVLVNTSDYYDENNRAKIEYAINKYKPAGSSYLVLEYT